MEADMGTTRRCDVAWPDVEQTSRGPKRQPEDSVELRAWVLAAVLVGEAAVLTSGYFGAVTGVLVPLLTVVAFVVSYRRRRERNILIKVLLAFGALAALAMFFREVLSSLYDTRVPLARLFLWVQVIHAFDLPARKDLSYSLVSGLILVAVGAVLSTSLWYGLFVLAFLLCAMGAMSQMNLSEARERAGAGRVEKQGPRARHRRALFLRRHRGRPGLLLPPSPAAGDEPDDDADLGFPGHRRENFTGGVQNPYYRPPGGIPSRVPRCPSPPTRTTASCLTWTSAAAGGSPTRS